MFYILQYSPPFY